MSIIAGNILSVQKSKNKNDKWTFFDEEKEVRMRL